MNKQGARVLLVISCLLAVAAFVQDYRFDRSNQHERTRLLSVERDTGTLLTSLAELRAGQTAYLATGQGPDFWMRRVTELSGQIESGLARLRSTTTSALAQSSLGTARTALADLMQMDGRARSAVSSDQRFLASDILLADSLTSAQVFAEALAVSRDAEAAAAETILRRNGYMRMALAPTAVLLVLLAAYNAGRHQRKPQRSQAEEVAQMIRDLPPPVKAPALTVSALASAATPAPTPIPVPLPTVAALPIVAAPLKPVSVESAPASPISWTDTAELCVDLARVMDARDMPSLLERAARTLDASGIILWLVDSQGQTLTPALSHGYSDRVLAKLGTLDVSADNVTSLSYRSKRPQSMAAARAGSASAIAVPLVTTDGCNGVLAAEVPGDRPATECVAVARILAAQFATILSPVESPAGNVAEA